jgi:hypothetical protein
VYGPIGANHLVALSDGRVVPSEATFGDVEVAVRPGNGARAGC